MTTTIAATAADVSPPARPSFAETTKVWAKIGLLSFGGPAGQIALMHRMLVDEQRWVGERQPVQGSAAFSNRSQLALVESEEPGVRRNNPKTRQTTHQKTLMQRDP